MKKIPKKITSVILAFILSFGVCSVAFATSEGFIKEINQKTIVPNGFTGIYTAEDLNNIRNNLSGKYILMNDIDLSSYDNWIPIGNRNEAFNGLFAGNGYSIKNLKINISENTEIMSGLFGYIKNAIIFNLSIVNTEINIVGTEDVYVGAIVGLSSGGTITNCISSGSITVSVSKKGNVGGIAGYSKTDIINCFSDISVKVDCGTRLSYIGGVVGVTYNKISQSASQNSLSVNSNGDGAMIVVGGIAGGAFNEVINCFNISAVSAYSSSFATVGGIAGESYSITNCYNIGEISVKTEKEDLQYISVGGISGFTNFKLPSIDQPTEEKYNSYLTNCYYLNNLSQATSISETLAMKNVASLTIDEMKNKNSFLGFDFEKIWSISEMGTPYIVSEVSNTPETLELKTKEIQSVFESPTSIVWKFSTNENVAVMDNMGNVEGFDEGTTSITFITSDGQFESCEISVTKTTFIKTIVEFFMQIVDFLFGWIFN